MRDLFKITVSDMPLEKRKKAIDIISRAIVAEFGKRVIIVRDGEFSHDAIIDITPSTNVFIICEN